jgi:predicted metalloendopeptidase
MLKNYLLIDMQQLFSHQLFNLYLIITLVLVIPAGILQPPFFHGVNAPR